MIIFLRNEYTARPRHDTMCCAIRAKFVEVFPNRIEFVPKDGDPDVTQIDVDSVKETYTWGDAYDFCCVYDDSVQDSLRDEFHACKWF